MIAYIALKQQSKNPHKNNDTFPKWIWHWKWLCFIVRRRQLYFVVGTVGLVGRQNNNNSKLSGLTHLNKNKNIDNREICARFGLPIQNESVINVSLLFLFEFFELKEEYLIRKKIISKEIVYMKNQSSQPVFNYSKLTIETLEQGVKYVRS